jgi:hypothetical protein
MPPQYQQPAQAYRQHVQYGQPFNQQASNTTPIRDFGVMADNPLSMQYRAQAQPAQPAQAAQPAYQVSPEQIAKQQELQAAYSASGSDADRMALQAHEDSMQPSDLQRQQMQQAAMQQAAMRQPGMGGKGGYNQRQTSYPAFSQPYQRQMGYGGKGGGDPRMMGGLASMLSRRMF